MGVIKDFGYSRDVGTPGPVRGDFETLHLKGLHGVTQSALEIEYSPFFLDTINKIRFALGLEGAAELIKGEEAFSAAYNDKSEKKPFSPVEQTAIWGVVFEKILGGLNEYASDDLDSSVKKGISLVKNGMAVAELFKDEKQFKQSIHYAIIDRLKNAPAFNPTTSLMVREVALLAKVANATGIQIPEEVKKYANSILINTLLEDINHSKFLGGIPSTAKILNEAVTALDARFNGTHQGVLREAFVKFVDRTLEDSSPTYLFAMNRMKSTFETMGIEFTADLKDRFYPKIVKKGLAYIFNERDAAEREHAAGMLLDSLRSIGAPESSIDVEKIRITSTLAQADVRDFCQDERVSLRQWAKGMQIKLAL